MNRNHRMLTHGDSESVVLDYGFFGVEAIGLFA